MRSRGTIVVSLSEIARRVYPDERRGGKPDHYFDRYADLFAHLRNEPISLLELGVEKGGSVRVWQEYFPKATLVGLDFHQKPDGYPSDAHFVQGRQEDPEALARACELGGSPFDIIIDDAGHVGRLAKASYEYLYEDHLKAGGYYILEDWGAALSHPNWTDAHPYEEPVDDGDRLPSFEYGMVGQVKQLIDQLLLVRDPVRVDVQQGFVVVHKK